MSNKKVCKQLLLHTAGFTLLYKRVLLKGKKNSKFHNESKKLLKWKKF